MPRDDDDSGSYLSPYRGRTDHGERIGRHSEAIATLKEEVRGLREDISEIKEIVSNVKGGWKVLLAFGTGASFLGALLAKFFGVLKGMG